MKKKLLVICIKYGFNIHIMDDIPTKIHDVPAIPTNNSTSQHNTDYPKQLSPCPTNPIIQPNRDKFESEKYDLTCSILDK